MKNLYPFKGQFKDLKSKGYEFWKAFARNYKVYSKDIKPGYTINVWVANGGYIEYRDLYSHTANFFEALKNLKDGDFHKDRVCFLFDWNDCNKKPEIHTEGLDMRVLEHTMEHFEEEYDSRDAKVRCGAYDKSRDILTGGREMHEVIVYRETVQLILAELELIES